MELRPSKKEEVAQAVSLIYSSGPPTFEYVFKNDSVGAVDFLNHAFVREGGEFSYQNHYSLYDKGQMVGIGSVFSSKESTKFTIADALNIFRFYKFSSLGVVRRGLQVEGIIKLPIKNEIVLAHLAIEPALRGKGYGTKMIALLMGKANKSATDIFILDVSEENPKAKALYDRLGFVTTQKNISTLKNKYFHVANHFRMELRN